jgi:hypothetical protein
MQSCNRIYYSKVTEGSTCFERHTAHHQEPQTVFAASGLYTYAVTGRGSILTVKISDPFATKP